MAEWLYEAGIGEERAILVDDGEIRAARIEWGEGLRPGLVAEARLVARRPASRQGTVRFAGGAEALVSGLAPEHREGATLIVTVTRAAIGERGRTKLPQARATPDALPAPAPTLFESLRQGAIPVRTLLAGDQSFAAHGWGELCSDARDGSAGFPGGALTVSPTPAMTLIDVDGALPPRELALAAIPAIAKALGRFDIAGAIGIDFPTLAARADRQALDAALAAALAEWRGERTAVNGFGFVQLVSRLERPSLIALLAQRPAAAGARALLRRAEHVAEPGALLLIAAPVVIAQLRPEWLAELTRRSGREVLTRSDPGLAPGAGFAQAVAR